MEYFNTCGGCTAAGAAGLAVLQAIEEDDLQANASTVGAHLLDALGRVQEVRMGIQLIAPWATLDRPTWHRIVVLRLVLPVSSVCSCQA